MVSDLPAAVGAGHDTIGYADDVTLWASDASLSALSSTLSARAKKMVDFAASNGLILNPEKTQLLLAGRKLREEERKTFEVAVADVTLTPAPHMEFLGVKIDHKLSFASHLTDVAESAKVKGALVRRLAAQVPQSYLRPLASGLVRGKTEYAAAAIYSPRLSTAAPTMGTVKTIQVAVNGAARAVCRVRLTDKTPVEQVLARSGLPSFNRAAAMMIAVETWKAAKSNDGPGSDRNPLGLILFGPRHNGAGHSNRAQGRNTCSRAHRAGKILPPLRLSADSFVYAAYQIWNKCEELRAAETLSAAKRAAKVMANSLPL